MQSSDQLTSYEFPFSVFYPPCGWLRGTFVAIFSSTRLFSNSFLFLPPLSTSPRYDGFVKDDIFHAFCFYFYFCSKSLQCEPISCARLRVYSAFQICGSSYFFHRFIFAVSSFLVCELQICVVSDMPGFGKSQQFFLPIRS
jgi:hypothetical protein